MVMETTAFNFTRGRELTEEPSDTTTTARLPGVPQGWPYESTTTTLDPNATPTSIVVEHAWSLVDHPRHIGHATAFTMLVLHLISYKSPRHSRPVLSAFSHLVFEAIDEGNLTLPLDLVQRLGQTSINMNEWRGPTLQGSAKQGSHYLKMKDEVFSEQMHRVQRMIDDLYKSEDDANALFQAVDLFARYRVNDDPEPGWPKARIVAEALFDAMMAPYYRIKGTVDERLLIVAIQSVLDQELPVLVDAESSDYFVLSTPPSGGLPSLRRRNKPNFKTILKHIISSHPKAYNKYSKRYHHLAQRNRPRDYHPEYSDEDSEYSLRIPNIYKNSIEPTNILSTANDRPSKKTKTKKELQSRTPTSTKPHKDTNSNKERIVKIVKHNKTKSPSPTSSTKRHRKHKKSHKLKSPKQKDIKQLQKRVDQKLNQLLRQHTVEDTNPLNIASYSKTISLNKPITTHKAVNKKNKETISLTTKLNFTDYIDSYDTYYGMMKPENRVRSNNDKSISLPRKTIKVHRKPAINYKDQASQNNKTYHNESTKPIQLFIARIPHSTSPRPLNVLNKHNLYLIQIGRTTPRNHGLNENSHRIRRLLPPLSNEINDELNEKRRLLKRIKEFSSYSDEEIPLRIKISEALKRGTYS